MGNNGVKQRSDGIEGEVGSTRRGREKSRGCVGEEEKSVVWEKIEGKSKRKERNKLG